LFAPTYWNKHKQVECWPMLTSKVSKYNNRNDNIIITISISNSSNPSIVHQHTTKWLQRQVVTHNRECCSDSNWYTHCKGKEHDQHIIRLTPVGSHVWQPFVKSLLHQNRFPIHGWSLGPRPHSPSHNILKAGIRFSEVVIGLLGLLGPIKTGHVVSTLLKTCHRS
jgi:hypothetical protein